MIYKKFKEITGQKLSNSSFLKLHKILKDFEENEHYINIFRSYILDESIFNNKRFYNTHVINESDWWDTISYQHYQTDAFWWIIAMTNNVVNPFEELEEGNELKILKMDFLYRVLNEIQTVGEL